MLRPRLRGLLLLVLRALRPLRLLTWPLLSSGEGASEPSEHAQLLLLLPPSLPLPLLPQLHTRLLLALPVTFLGGEGARGVRPLLLRRAPPSSDALRLKQRRLLGNTGKLCVGASTPMIPAAATACALGERLLRSAGPPPPSSDAPLQEKGGGAVCIPLCPTGGMQIRMQYIM